jgi:hypothetical protein
VWNDIYRGSGADDDVFVYNAVAGSDSQAIRVMSRRCHCSMGSTSYVLKSKYVRFE